MNDIEDKNISHGQSLSLEEAFSQIKRKVEERGDLPLASVKRQLELLEELASFPLGQFLLTHKGLNGYWIHYVVTHPEEKTLRKVHPLEDFLLTKAPTALATQERYQIFRSQIQKYLQDNIKLASIPCGLMGEFLTLDFSRINHISLTGIDIDPEALSHAEMFAKEKNIHHFLNVHLKDATELSISEEYDLISSSGLNIYESNPEKVTEFFRRLFIALRPEGVLITSFFTYPPNFGFKSEWNTNEISLEAALLQRILLSDLIEPRFQSFCSSKEIEKQLLSVGFDKVEIIYDKAHIFPTVIATKK